MENITLPNGYTLDIIPSETLHKASKAWLNHTNQISLPPPANNWSLKVNIYQALQQQCDRPAYVWHNFTLTHVPIIGIKYPQPLSLQDLINRHLGELMLHMIRNRCFDFQAFCDKR